MLILWDRKQKEAEKEKPKESKKETKEEERKVDTHTDPKESISLNSNTEFDILSKCPQTTDSLAPITSINLDKISIKQNSLVEAPDSVIINLVEQKSISNIKTEEETKTIPNIQQPMTKEQIKAIYQDLITKMFLCPDIHSNDHQENFLKVINGIIIHKDNFVIYSGILEILQKYFYEIIVCKGDGINFFEQVMAILGVQRFIFEYKAVIVTNVPRLLSSQNGCFFLIKLMMTGDIGTINCIFSFIISNFIVYATGDYSSGVICFLYTLANPIINNQFNQNLYASLDRLFFNFNARNVIQKAMEFSDINTRQLIAEKFAILQKQIGMAMNMGNNKA
ncbi:MAG: hypothetical protein MJ252_19615 [archaeon]|nr:hypothetical protein [archaeon]